MRRLIKILEIAESGFRKVRRSFLRKNDDQFRQLEKWYKEDPFDLKRSDFDFLSQHSTVFDLGGYTGQWSSDIAARYNCKVYIFEPVEEYAQLIKGRFAKNENIRVFAKGLAAEKASAMIKVDKFASRVSEDLQSDEGERIELEEFQTFLRAENVTSIDLIKINIEGAEYDLMDHLIATDTIRNIKAILIQFHNFVDDHEARRDKIQSSLSQTHKKVFDYPFIWELWIAK